MSESSQANVFSIGPLSIIDLVGADATQILHNLTTNDVKKLSDGAGCETFITDVRGKTIGHVCAFRHDFGYRLIGAPGQSDAIAAHMDRYTIREDATPNIRDDDFTCVVVNKILDGHSPHIDDSSHQLASFRSSSGSHEAYQTKWLSNGTQVWICPIDNTETFSALLESLNTNPGDDVQFHHARVVAGFPWFGIDMTDKNLPQEADREPQTICFTKGCYLGQETVARLDALGQVQKKLVQWKIEGELPKPGAEISCDGKVVGRLTTIVKSKPGESLALGFARRSHFDSGSTAEGYGDPEKETSLFKATVI